MATAASRRRTSVRPLVFPAGPFQGMRDALDPVSADPTRARLLQNCYPTDPSRPSAVVGRPGFQQSGSQLGASSKRTGQLVHQFTKLSGTTYTVAIVGGQGIYTFNWSTRAWSQVVTVANLSTNSITLSETARVYAVTFTDKLVISDGVNVPFMWDGTSGSGGLTKLTNCPVLYGQPVVHYAKLFGIKNTERNTMVWSEENDATIGYETSPYANAWTVGQTDQEALYALAATNEALFCFRANSITSVFGAINSEFTTAGTRDSVSDTIGTTSPASVLVYGKFVFFLDSLGRPQVIVGGQILNPPIWQDLRETMLSANLSALSAADAWYDPETRLVCIGFAETGLSHCSAIACFSPATLQAVSIFRGFTFNRVGVVYDATGRRIVMHLSTDGYAYDHGYETGTLWSDALNAGTEAIVHAVECMPLGYDTAFSKRWQRADFTFRSLGDITCTVTYSTPYGTSSALTLSLSSAGAARFDEAVFNTDVFADDSIELHGPVGWNGNGRWLSWRIAHSEVGKQFGLVMGTAKAIASDSSPTRP